MAGRKAFENLSTPEGLQLTPIEQVVASGTVESIKPGMMVAISSNAMAEAANGATACNGFGVSTSSETASVAGTVLVVRSARIRGYGIAQTPGNLSSSTRLTKVTLDVSGEDHLLDENDTSSGFIRLMEIGDTTTGRCLFEVDVTL